MKTIAILGSTGSIGTNALKVVKALGEEYRVVGLAAGRNTALLAQQAATFAPEWVYAEDREGLRSQPLPPQCRLLGDLNGLRHCLVQLVYLLSIH